MKLCTSCRESLQIAIVLLSYTVTVLCQRTVKGMEGQSITLPCSYRVTRSSDLTSMCWGRGSCPSSKCTQELIWTDGYKVTTRSSARYQLKGSIDRGIVSLTIAQANLEDAGTYCCRIEHQGWFNDEKINIVLTVEKAPPTTTVKTTTPAPTTLKTTPVPTTLKPTTTPPPVQTTPVPFIPLDTSEELTTHPVPSVTSPLPLIETTIPPFLTVRTVNPSTNVFAGATEDTDPSTPRSSEFPEVITENESQEVKPTSDKTTGTSYVSRFIPGHELTTFADSKDEEDDLIIPIISPETHSQNDNGISDLIQGNVTTAQKKDMSTIIIAISLSAIALIVICVILLQLKGQKRGRHLLGFDPHLELVNHADNPLTEIQAEAKDPSAVQEDKAETNHVELLAKIDS